MEHEYFEKLLDSRFDNVKNQHDHINEKLTAILVQTTKTNGRVKDLEKEVVNLNTWRATSTGHWSGVSKTITIIAAVIAFAGGIIATMLWH